MFPTATVKKYGGVRVGAYALDPIGDRIQRLTDIANFAIRTILAGIVLVAAEEVGDHAATAGTINPAIIS